MADENAKATACKPSGKGERAESMNGKKRGAGNELLSPEAFLGKLRDLGRNKYHDKHPFHLRLNEGTLSPLEVRAWIKNRFYYQTQIPIKDAIVLSKLPSREDRRKWIRRVMDHDGDASDPGGIEAWLCFGEAAGLTREDMLDESTLLPGVRFAVDAYVNFCRLHTWYESVASSLTEMFSPSLISDRMVAIRNHYPWIDESGLRYFQKRLSQAPADCDHALQLVLDYGTNEERQRQAIESLSFKCDVLWSILDAIDHECAGWSDDTDLA